MIITNDYLCKEINAMARTKTMRHRRQSLHYDFVCISISMLANNLFPPDVATTTAAAFIPPQPARLNHINTTSKLYCHRPVCLMTHQRWMGPDGPGQSSKKKHTSLRCCESSAACQEKICICCNPLLLRSLPIMSR